MNHLDTINGVFETIGACAAWADVRKVRRDRSVAGVYWPMRAVWSAWGFWNLYYYGSLGHWLSTSAGLVLALGNTVWVAHAFMYARRPVERVVSLAEFKRRTLGKA